MQKIEEIPSAVIDQAKQLYDTVWRYYMFKVACIKLQDYELIAASHRLQTVL